eukprot:scaffold33011_cov73-Isochrysis_galbana.AAC.1
MGSVAPCALPCGGPDAAIRRPPPPAAPRPRATHRRPAVAPACAGVRARAAAPPTARHPPRGSFRARLPWPACRGPARGSERRAKCAPGRGRQGRGADGARRAAARKAPAGEGRGLGRGRSAPLRGAVVRRGARLPAAPPEAPTFRSGLGGGLPRRSPVVARRGGRGARPRLAGALAG